MKHRQTVFDAQTLSVFHKYGLEYVQSVILFDTNNSVKTNTIQIAKNCNICIASRYAETLWQCSKLGLSRKVRRCNWLWSTAILFEEITAFLIRKQCNFLRTLLCKVTFSNVHSFNILLSHYLQICQNTLRVM